jgi:hypothetical protein
VCTVEGRWCEVKCLSHPLFEYGQQVQLHGQARFGAPRSHSVGRTVGWGRPWQGAMLGARRRAPAAARKPAPAPTFEEEEFGLGGGGIDSDSSDDGVPMPKPKPAYARHSSQLRVALVGVLLLLPPLVSLGQVCTTYQEG